ncbi:NAD(P)-binding protein [Xylariaceae sp. FL0662B]|nr:NAD(P)-binding protein [Xylariaceae sp. FL0662B]
MAGTVLLTGANGSLAIPGVEHLLSKYPDFTAVLTVRNASEADTNTQRLRNTISNYPNAKASIHELDLANLTAVHEFATSLATSIGNRTYPPLAAIICNAYFWDHVGDPILTADGFEKTFQVNHIAYAALALRLLGKFKPTGGRIMFFTSDAHWPGKNMLEKFPPGIPDDLEKLVKPPSYPDETGRGFQRYANSKLAVLMWVYALNRRLENDPKLNNITAVAINPGNLVDSRALRTNTPPKLVNLQRFILQPLKPLLRLTDPTMRTAAEAGVDVIELAVKLDPHERGFFTLLKKDQSSPESLDVEKQQKLWTKTAGWARITKENTTLASAFE